MSSGDSVGDVHPVRTQRHQYQHLFHAKHHGRGSADDAQWSEDLGRDERGKAEEFNIFDEADRLDIADRGGNLYGLRLDENRRVLDLGTWGQQVAKFPKAHPNHPWHGYPLWAIKLKSEINRDAEQYRPHKSVFIQMENAGMISRRDWKRLSKGYHT